MAFVQLKQPIRQLRMALLMQSRDFFLSRVRTILFEIFFINLFKLNENDLKKYESNVDKIILLTIFSTAKTLVNV